MSIRFIFFDAGFTLLHPSPSVGHYYAQSALRYGVAADVARLDQAFVPAWRAMRKLSTHPLPYGRNLDESLVFWTAVVKQCFVEAGAEAPRDPAYYREVFDLFASADCWQLYADVAPALELLRQAGVPWGVLSNWDARLHPVLDGFGELADRTCAIISSEVGAEKPSRAIFEAGQRAAGVAPGEIALIGDEADSDGHGAIEAGWQQCLVWRNGTKAPPANLISEQTLTKAVETLLANQGRFSQR